MVNMNDLVGAASVFRNVKSVGSGLQSRFLCVFFFCCSVRAQLLFHGWIDHICSVVLFGGEAEEMKVRS